MTAAKALAQAGYSKEQIRVGLEYADTHDWADEDERGAYALARILCSDEQLLDNPKAPWEPIC